MGQIPSDSTEAGKFIAVFEQIAELAQKQKAGEKVDLQGTRGKGGAGKGTGNPEDLSSQKPFDLKSVLDNLDLSKSSPELEALKQELNRQLKQAGNQLQAIHEQVVDNLNDGLKSLKDAASKAAEKAEKSATEKLDDAAAKATEDITKKAVEEAVEAAKKVVAPKFEITLPDMKETVTIEDDIVHPEFDKALRILHGLGILWLCGPAGCGKTHLAGQLAKALSLPFYTLSCTAGLSESWFIGRRDLTGEYLEPEFLKLYETGGVVLLDEFDAADPNTTLIINSAISNGYLAVPMRVGNAVAQRHKDFKLVIATNTWGLGPDGNYSGREGLDASTRDRAVLAKIAMEYSTTVEAAFLPPTKIKPVQAKPSKIAPHYAAASLADVFYHIRENIEQHRLRRILSTRAFEQGARLLALGFSNLDVLEIFFEDWTNSEREKVLNVVGQRT